MSNRHKSPARVNNAESDGYTARLAQAKRESTLQVLFKVARLLDEAAVARVAKRQGHTKLRRSHTSLLPHIDLAGTRITDLAERLGITKQAVSQLVDDLEGLGVLARVADPEDARARRVVFTRRGREGLLDGLQVLRDLERELSQQVGEKHMASLREALLLLHDRLLPGVREG